MVKRTIVQWGCNTASPKPLRSESVMLLYLIVKTKKTVQLMF